MSVYNARIDWLRAAVDSVLRQTLDGFELIVIDDGAEPAIRACLQAITDPRIRYVRNETNLGLAASLNRGLALANGAYLARQDADDLSEPDRLARQAAFLDDRPDVGFLGAAFTVIDEHGRRLSVIRTGTSDVVLRQRLATMNPFCHGSVMMRREGVRSLGGYRALDTCQDYDLWCRMAERCRIANLAEPLYRWRLSSRAVSIHRAVQQREHLALIQRWTTERRQHGVDSYASYLRVPRATKPETVNRFWGFPIRDAAAVQLLQSARLAAYGNPLGALRVGLRGLAKDPFNARLWGFLLTRPAVHGWRRARNSSPSAGRRAKTAVLFISCWSLREPQCERLNVEPLRRLAARGYRIHLMTFERPPYRGRLREISQWRAALERDGIHWRPVTYHHRPLLLAKAWDGFIACWIGWRLIRRESVGLIHARSEFPAVIAAILRWLTRCVILYESDAPISEERIDTGVWRATGLVCRVTAAFERWLPRVSREMVVLSRRYAQQLRAQGVGVPITVLPCCTDVDRFQRDAAARREIRAAEGWEDRLVFIYSGSLGGWYRFEEMADFFAQLQRALPRAHWLCLINERSEDARALIAQRGIPPGSVTVRSVPPEEVPAWLSASDIALSFIRAGSSKYASSPTKMAEYLSCGLPVILTPGIGDTEELVTDPLAGHVLQGFDPASYREAIAWVEGVAPHLEEAAAVCRRIAEERLAVQGIGVQTYQAIYARLTGGSESPDRGGEPALPVNAPQEAVSCLPA